MNIKQLLLVVTLVAFFVTGLLSYDSNDVDVAYKYLSKNWVYYTAEGKKVEVKNLGKGCSGKDCYLKVNNTKVDPKKIYKLSKTQLVSVVDGSKGGQVNEQEATDNTPNNKGNEPVNNNAVASMKGMAEAHNVYRKKTGVPDLVWDDAVAKYAQQWADNLKSKGCDMQHRSPNKYGENLAWASGMALDPQKVVKMWYDEVNDYNYAKNTCKPGKMCGHYTQVVWKNSTKVGCGMAKCGSTEIWVCNYNPPGNYVGQKPY